MAGSEETTPNPFRYVGKYGVMDDENGLLYMRARYYDPELKRFITKDPIGFAGGVNLYAYVGGNPVVSSDPWGLCDEKKSYNPNWFDYLTRYGYWGGPHWGGAEWIPSGGVGDESVPAFDWVDKWWKYHDTQLMGVKTKKGATARTKAGSMTELIIRTIYAPKTVTIRQQLAVGGFFLFGHD